LKNIQFGSISSSISARKLFSRNILENGVRVFLAMYNVPKSEHNMYCQFSIYAIHQINKTQQTDAVIISSTYKRSSPIMSSGMGVDIAKLHDVRRATCTSPLVELIFRSFVCNKWSFYYFIGVIVRFVPVVRFPTADLVSLFQQLSYFNRFLKQTFLSYRCFLTA
jgi:hypothetical protein